MNYIGHISVWLIIFLGIVFLEGWNYFDMLPLFIIGALSAILPDIDHQKSKANYLLNFLVLLPMSLYLSISTFKDIWFASLIGLALFAVCIVFINIIRPRHRGITHSLFAVAVFSLIIYLATRNETTALVCCAGYVSHLLADMEFKWI